MPYIKGSTVKDLQPRETLRQRIVSNPRTPIASAIPPGTLHGEPGWPVSDFRKLDQRSVMLTIWGEEERCFFKVT